MRLFEDLTSCKKALSATFGGFNVVWESALCDLWRILRRVGEGLSEASRRAPAPLHSVGDLGTPPLPRRHCMFETKVQGKALKSREISSMTDLSEPKR